MSPELLTFIKEGLAKGLSREELRAALREAQWSDDEIDSGFRRFAVSDFPIPVPAPKASLSAREAFIYLVIFVTLYLTAFSVGSLWFSFIDHWLPDALFPNYAYANASGIRQACATLLITAPIFFVLSWRMRGELKKHPEERQSGVRKWLTYLTLFVAASIIIGTLIGLVHNVLSGELTLRFFLKAATVLAITGVGFGYYLWDLHQDDVLPRKPIHGGMRALVLAVVVMTFGSLIGGLILSGSPTQERLRRLDEQKVQTLERVTYAIDAYYARTNRIPTSAADLWLDSRNSDPELINLTSQIPDFRYAPTSSTTYQLCASFVSATSDFSNPSVISPTTYNAPRWDHSAGLVCYPLDVRREAR